MFLLQKSSIHKFLLPIRSEIFQRDSIRVCAGKIKHTVVNHKCSESCTKIAYVVFVVFVKENFSAQ